MEGMIRIASDIVGYVMGFRIGQGSRQTDCRRCCLYAGRYTGAIREQPVINPGNYIPARGMK
jgi:hypothetical protein